MTLTDETAALAAGLRGLGSTQQESLMANNNTALEILGIAKNRLNKFYNPAMHKEPAAFVQLHSLKQTEEDAAMARR